MSRCRLLCWNTRSTQILRKLDPCLNSSASFIIPELMRMGKGYWEKRWGNLHGKGDTKLMTDVTGHLTMASACSPTLADLRPFSSSARAAWDSDSELDTDIVMLSQREEFRQQRASDVQRCVP